ncbi:SigE family RNA polymerase sigma factor [Rarobacter faecitabidus]|uniref:RNA polymerase sigma-70 factor (ECF subfamily) n=1 Tax=Rarobacter faecitabidus TaxID=13243 RepID=A0A542ZDS3_RARFA|nr:RNA polymerase sigma factor [Rarobacter faecitabidus]TQL58503.1 RNA polymerase sigma-70 factor (ECF subfamily) [Rarobacter faecitabidus]
MASWDEALTAVLDQHGTSLYAYGRILTGSTADSEDLVHDAIVRVFARMKSRPARLGARSGTDVTTAMVPGATAAYVRRAMLTIYIDQTRRAKRWRAIRHAAATAESLPDHADEAASRSAIAAALSSLSPQQRACLLLRYYDDLTTLQIADALGLAHGTVKRHLHDALSRLRDDGAAMALWSPGEPAARGEEAHRG